MDLPDCVDRCSCGVCVVYETKRFPNAVMFFHCGILIIKGKCPKGFRER